MLRVYSCIAQDHDLRLLVIAVAICLLSQLTGAIVAADIRRMGGKPLRRWLLTHAFVVAAGIWATHFIAMLAYQPELPSAYSPWFTALSFLACMSLCYATTLARTLAARTLFMTAGVGTMHFIGMAALETTGRLVYDPVMVAASLCIGALFALVSQKSVARFSARIPVVPAVLMTAAVASIHFGAMAAITIIPDPRAVISASAIDQESLAIVVAALVVAAMIVSFAVLRLESRLASNAAEETDRMKLFADKAMEGLAILDGTHIADANMVFWSMSGYAEPGPDQADLAHLIPGLADMTPERGAGFFETTMHRRGGDILQIEAALRRTTISGKSCVLLVVRDITERKAVAARISHMANHDPLTGVGNRLTFNRVIEERLAAASPAQPLGLLCIDLDRFKPVNDLYGHLVGDAVLIEATQRIAALLGKGELLARLGGDEFAVLTARSPRAASQLAEQIIKALSTPFALDDHVISINASLGIAYAPTDADDAQTLHSRADLALYRAKSDGRGRFCFFDRGMDEQVIETFRMKAELRTALQEGQFVLHYQPLASLDSGDVIGFEALLRWNHPERGEVSPSTCIPLAEETGLIIPIGEWVLREACREAATWSKPLKIAVNLSPVQFTAGNLVDVVASALASSGLDAQRLDLEITEGVLVKDAVSALRTLNALKALGVRISMDDFGTGYSSLSYFRQFPFRQGQNRPGFHPGHGAQSAVARDHQGDRRPRQGSGHRHPGRRRRDAEANGNAQAQGLRTDSGLRDQPPRPDRSVPRDRRRRPDPEGRTEAPRGLTCRQTEAGNNKGQAIAARPLLVREMPASGVVPVPIEPERLR